MFFWTLPIALRGRSSTKTTRFGILNFASRPWCPSIRPESHPRGKFAKGPTQRPTARIAGPKVSVITKNFPAKPPPAGAVARANDSTSVHADQLVLPSTPAGASHRLRNHLLGDTYVQ